MNKTADDFTVAASAASEVGAPRPLVTPTEKQPYLNASEERLHLILLASAASEVGPVRDLK